jgi:hypothetical protein
MYILLGTNVGHLSSLSKLISLREAAVYKPSKGGLPWVLETYFIKPQNPLVSSKKHLKRKRQFL